MRNVYKMLVTKLRDTLQDNTKMDIDKLDSYGSIYSLAASSSQHKEQELPIHSILHSTDMNYAN